MHTHMRDEKLRPAPQLTPELLLRNGWAARHGISQVSLTQSRLMLFRPEEYRDRSGGLQPQGDTSREFRPRFPRRRGEHRDRPRHRFRYMLITISMKKQQIPRRGGRTGTSPGRGECCKLASSWGAHARERLVLTNNAWATYLSAVKIHGGFGTAPV